jgi:hypothetical protein
VSKFEILDFLLGNSGAKIYIYCSNFWGELGTIYFLIRMLSTRISS